MLKNKEFMVRKTSRNGGELWSAICGDGDVGSWGWDGEDGKEDIRPNVLGILIEKEHDPAS